MAENPAQNQPDEDDIQVNGLEEVPNQDLANLIQAFQQTLTPLPNLEAPKTTDEFENFIHKFELQTRALNYNNARKLRVLPSFFNGTIRELYMSLPDDVRDHYPNLVEHMMNLCAPMAKDVYKAKFFSIKQGDDSIQTYASKLMEAARRSLDDDVYNDEARMALLKDRFTMGLKPQYIGKALDKNNLAFHDLVREMSKYESFTTLKDSSSVIPEIEQLTKQVRKVLHIQQRPQRPRYNNEGYTQCNYCKRYGHIYKNCRKRISDSQNNRFGNNQNYPDRNKQYNNNRQNNRFKPYNERNPRRIQYRENNGQNYRNNNNNNRKNFNQNYRNRPNSQPPVRQLNNLTQSKNPDQPKDSLSGLPNFSFHISTEKDEKLIPDWLYNPENSIQNDPIVNNFSENVNRFTLPRVQTITIFGLYTIFYLLKNFLDNTFPLLQPPHMFKTLAKPFTLLSTFSSLLFTIPMCRFNNKSIMLPLIAFTILSGISQINAITTTGYDCSEPMFARELSIADIGNCTIHEHNTVNETKALYVYQESEYVEADVLHCILKRNIDRFNCGWNSHKSTIETLHEDSVLLTPEQCETAAKMKEITLTFNGNKIILPAKVNHTVKTYRTTAGKTWDDGGCEAQDIYINNNLKRIVETSNFFFTITKYTAVFKRKDFRMRNQRYEKCDLLKRYCQAKEETLIFGKPKYNCPLVKLKQSIFDIIKAKSDDKTDDHNSNLGVAVSHNHQDAIRFILRKKTTKCGHIVKSTNYKNIFISELPIPTARPSPKIHDTSFMLYMNNKVDALHHQTQDDIKQLYYDTLKRDCELNQEIILTKIAFAVANPNMIAPLLRPQDGIYGKIAGETMIIFKCKPVEATLSPIKECTSELPVLIDGIRKFLHPVSRVIMDKPTKLTFCNNILRPKFRIKDDKWIALPDMIPVPPIPPIDPDIFEKNLNFLPIEKMNENGVYNSKDLTAITEYLLFPQKEAHLLAELTHGARYINNGERLALDNFLHPNHFEKASRQYIEKVWGFFKDFGNFFSGFIGIYVIIIFFKLLLKQLLSSWNIFRLFGFSWQLILAICPFLANSYITHHHTSLHRQKDVYNNIYSTIKKSKSAPQMTGHYDLNDNETTSEPSPILDTITIPKPEPPPRLTTFYLGNPDTKRVSFSDDTKFPPPDENLTTPTPNETPSTTKKVYPLLKYSKLWSKNHHLTNLQTQLPGISIRVNKLPITALLDTGSATTLISAKLAKFLHLPTSPNEIKMFALNHQPVSLLGATTIELRVANYTFVGQTVHVYENADFDCLLGIDVLSYMSPFLIDLPKPSNHTDYFFDENRYNPPSMTELKSFFHKNEALVEYMFSPETYQLNFLQPDAHTSLPTMLITVNGITVEALIDTGSDATFIHKSLADQLNLTLHDVSTQVFTLGNSSVDILGTMYPDFSLQDVHIGRHPALVFAEGRFSVILGTDILVYVSPFEISIPILQNPVLHVASKEIVPPNSIKLVHCLASAPLTTHFLASSHENIANKQFSVVPGICEKNNKDQFILVANRSDKPLNLYPKTKLASLHFLNDQRYVGHDVDISQKHFTLKHTRQKRLDYLLHQFQNIFEDPEQCQTTAFTEPHYIDLKPGTRPIKQRSYRTPLALKEIMKQKVFEMMEKEVIRHSFSPWGSPCLLVKKKD